MSYAIYRNKSDNKINKIQKNLAKYSPAEIETLVNDFNTEEGNDRIVEINDNNLIGEILDYLENTKQLENDFKSAIKKDLLENIERSQSELNDLEMFVYNFEDKECNK